MSFCFFICILYNKHITLQYIVAYSNYLYTENIMTSLKRYTDLDFLRIFAIFFVIFNHTEDFGYNLYTFTTPGSLVFWAYLFISVFCTFSVSVFFAISGALLLKKDESIEFIWRKRISKILITLVSVSFLYYFIQVIYGRVDFNLSEFLSTLYSSRLSTPLWYLYAYIAFLIALPFLRSLVRNLENKHFIYLFSIVLFYESVLPLIESLLFSSAFSFNSNLKPSWLFASIFIYPCLGYFVQNKLDLKKCGIYIPILWIINIFSILLRCYVTYSKIISPDSPFVFNGGFGLINCATIFITFKWIFSFINPPEFICKVISSLGSSTFGIYLLHSLLLGKRIPVFKKLWIAIYSIPGINKMLAAFIITFLIMIIAYVITLILKRIPFIKKIIS